MQDQEIIQGCIKGNEVHQNCLVKKYSAYLYSISLRYCNSEATSKDCLQDAFILVFKSIKKFDFEKGTLKSWMSKIIINVCLKKLKKEKRHIYQELTNTHESELPFTKSEIEDRTDKEYLLKILQALPNINRQVFNLSAIEGYSHKEISCLLNISIANSRSILFRSRALLKQKLINNNNRNNEIENRSIFR